ncbi:MAG: HdeD family acid-resistance protein [Xanthobacteraceae bacterium]
MTALNIRGTNAFASGLEPLRANWGWIVALGVLFVVLGLIALGSVVAATAASVFVVGIMMVIAGVAEIVHAFQVKTWGKFLLWLVLGALYVLAGAVTFSNPLLAAAILTLVLGASLVASGIMRIMLAFGLKEGTPWIAVALSGVITLVLGLMILARWPVSSLYVLGIFLGIDLVFAGASWIAIGLGLKTRAQPVTA